MARLKKFAGSAAMLFIAAAILLTGCGGKSSGTQDTTAGDKTDSTVSTAATTESAPKPVALKWVAGGPGKQQDADEVWAEFNKKLAEALPNTTVSFEIIPFDEYADKWKLLAASGDPVDIAWTGWMLNYVDEIQMGAYMELDQLIDQYAPDIKKEVPAFVLDLAKYNGKTYSIPCYQQMQDDRRAIVVPKDLGDKYWNVSDAQKVFASNETFVKANYDAIEPYLKNLKDAKLLGKGVQPFTPTNGYFRVYGDYYIKMTDKDCKVINFNETPEIQVAFSTMADWYQKGYIRKDIATDTTDYSGKKDGYTLWTEQIVKDPVSSLSTRYGMDVDVADYTNYWAISANQSDTSNVIPRTAANPERAMQLLNLMNTSKGKDLLNLISFGLEGVHYKKVSDNRIETIGYTGGADAKSPYGLNNWVMGNTFNTFETQTDAEGFRDFLVNEVHAKAQVSPLLGFKFDTTPVKNEVTQLNAVRKEYRDLLNWGAYGANYKAKYDEMISKMKTAGIDKITVELQRQADEFLKVMGKK